MPVDILGERLGQRVGTVECGPHGEGPARAGDDDCPHVRILFGDCERTQQVHQHRHPEGIHPVRRVESDDRDTVGRLVGDLDVLLPRVPGVHARGHSPPPQTIVSPVM
ncbi:hypothetical protein GOAMI_27_00630 [Gordonia amicalis NBRC 100051 = JCM 11271]|nr:hypothetical protein GOAMI_27_00630 [Gordonia amicalis NBRC 100051 = JCM 11271]